jgi:ERCC4-related helicase
MEFVPGARVRARGLPWDVLAVEQLGSQQLLRMRCVAGDLRGLEWDFLHPAEPIVSERASLRPEKPGPLALWRLQHQAALLEQIPPADELLANEPGRIRIEPYQLVPLMHALELPRPRLLIADDVGLGKTIEAGLVVCELIARRRAHRVLVVSPAGPLLTQWEQELRQRFGLRFTPITDSGALHAARRRLELGGNPFDATALCLTSLDFAKQEHVLEELERSAWDVAVIDEAHHCFGEASERDDTQRRRLAEVIARRSDGLLLLTATPHDGYDPHFASLIELLDPSLVDGSGGLIGNAYRRHVVRRLKSHIRDAGGGPMFRKRRVIPVSIGLDGGDAAPVRAFHRALAALVAPRLRRATRQDDMDALAFVSLLKRSVSTIEACLNTLRVVSERCGHGRGSDSAALRKERARALRAYRRRVLRFGVLDVAAEADAGELEAEGMAADLAAHNEAAALASLIRLGERARAHDPKLAALCHVVGEIRSATPGANVLVYTEYADSQLAALHTLRTAVDGEVLAINGLDSEDERARVAERCAEQDNIVLLSTDALAEGLNLQRRCWHLIHLDLPYNPNRLEQRNGRIDRYGQTREPQIRYLYLAGTFEERLLLRLIGKYEKARAQLDLMPETLGVTADASALNERLIAGFAERQASLFEEAPSPIRTLERAGEEVNAQAWRELMREIDRAFAGHERIAVRHGWLQGINAEAAQTVKAATLRRSSDVDLPGFVAAAMRIDERHRYVLHLPADWCEGLEGLPGYDAARRTLRITRDRDRLHDEAGRSLAYLGRAHPFVQRAITRAWRSDADGNRVGVARAGAEPALLLTFCAEMRGRQRIEWQRVIAVLVGKSSGAEVVELAPWLRRARECAADDIWCRVFKRWAPRRIVEAEDAANAEMQRLAEASAAQQGRRMRRAEAELRHWLDVRAREICGAFRPPTGDLFGASPSGPSWRWLGDPVERLAAFVADGSNAPARRREANSVIELFQQRAKEGDDAAMSPALHRLGMLMLIP